MAIAPYQPKKIATPQTGDDIEYMGGHYVLRLRGQVYQVFQDGQYVTINGSKLVQTAPRKWVYDENKKASGLLGVGQMLKWIVTINVGGKVEDFAVNAESEGKAKNKGAGIVAQRLGLTYQGAWMVLKRPTNSISVKRA